MNIAVASGKGGTGKTTIATNLAFALSQGGRQVTYADCDVEEPNGHLFLKPVLRERERIGIPVPLVDAVKCTGCGLCAKICQYSAIVCLNGKVVTFPELCHGCGGCVRVCPVQAISETRRPIGIVERGVADGVSFIHGRLDVGMVMSPPLIRAVKERLSSGGDAIIDAPPGTSCPVITAIQDTDYVVLVTEPTPFGLNDLGLAIAMANELNRPFGIVVNRHEEGNSLARDFCRAQNALILGEIPNDRRIAEAYSDGVLACRAVPAIVDQFNGLWESIRQHIEADGRLKEA